MAGDERGKGALGLPGGVLSHQLHVIGCHLPIHARLDSKGDKEIKIFRQKRFAAGQFFWDC
jgi:hypothetical protein